jgi:hypothetical protein
MKQQRTDTDGQRTVREGDLVETEDWRDRINRALDSLKRPPPPVVPRSS